jgi:biotin transporter BioY
MAAALVAILMIGTTWLSLSVGGWQEAFALGTAPFLIGEALKAGVVILTLPAAWKLVKTLDGRNR